MIVIQAASRRVTGLAYSPDGRLLAASCAGGLVKVWETATLWAGEPLWEDQIDHDDYMPGDASHVAFSPDGTRVLACGDSGGVWAWDPLTGSPREQLPGPRRRESFTNVLVCSRDGKYVAWAGGFRNAANRISVARLKPRRFHRQFLGHNEAIGLLAAAPDGLLSGSADRRICFWEWTTGRMYHELALRGFVRALAVAPGGDRFAASTGDTVHVWPLVRSAEARKLLPGRRRELRGHTRMVSCVEFSPDGATLASSADDGTLRLWDAGTGAERRALAPGLGPLHWIAFAPDGLTLAVSSDLGHVVLIDLDD